MEQWRIPQVAGLPGVCWGVRSMLQVEGRQNWIPENKGVGWIFRKVGISAQTKYTISLHYTRHTQSGSRGQLQTVRIIPHSRMYNKINAFGKITIRIKLRH